MVNTLLVLKLKYHPQKNSSLRVSARRLEPKEIYLTAKEVIARTKIRKQKRPASPNSKNIGKGATLFRLKPQRNVHLLKPLPPGSDSLRVRLLEGPTP